MRQKNSNFSLFLIFLFWICIPLSSFAKTDKPAPTLSPEQIQKKKEVLSKVLKFGTSQERKQALGEVVHFPKESADSIYKEMIVLLKAEKDMGMKIAFLRAFGEIQFELSYPVILLFFDDTSDEVSRQAIMSARKLKIPEAQPPLSEKVKKEDFTKNSNTLSLYLQTLAELPNGKEISPYLLDRFKEKFNHADAKSQIALFFGNTQEKLAEEALIDIAFDDAQPNTLRCYSINALGKIRSENARPKLKELADSLKKTSQKLDAKKAQSLKMYTVGALVQLGDLEILQELYEFARDDDPTVRLRAIEYLGNLKDPGAMELLEYKRDRDPSTRVQRAAKAAIDKINGINSPPEADIPLEEGSN